MPRFRYIARGGAERREGVVEAASMPDAATSLRREGLMILSLHETDEAAGTDARALRAGGRRLLLPLLIRNIQVEVVLGQLSSLLAGGVPILAALKAVQGQASAVLGRVLGAVAGRVRGGSSLSRSMEAEAPFMDRTTLGLLTVGEANGTVAEMLGHAARLMRRVREVRSQILQAFSYPALVTVGAIGVATYMVWVVFPKVLKFIKGQRSNVDLPAVSRALINVSYFMTDYGLYVLLAPVGLAVAFGLLRRTDRAGAGIDRATLRAPLLGKALRAANNAMWTRTLGTLIRSGIDIVSSLDLVERTLGNRHYRRQLRTVRETVRRGRSLSDGLAATDLKRLCPLAEALVAVGERAGGVDDALLQAAEDSDARLDRRLKLLARMIEPAIFVIVGGMVGFVYFGFFMAMLAATKSVR
jgi:type IV pilus assembly protein PilC